MRCTSDCTIGRDSVPRGLDCTSAVSWSSLTRLLPSKATRLMTGASTTLTTRRPPGPARKYERIVSASTRRLPSTTMDETVCAAAVRAAKTQSAAEPSAVPPRTTQTRASPRSIRTQGFIRYAPHSFSVGPPGDPRIPPPGLYSLFPAPQPFSPTGSPFAFKTLQACHAHYDKNL